MNIFNYIAYRNYFRDLLEEKKGEGKPVVHRELLTHLGVSSTGFLSNVLSGKNNFTTHHIYRLARIFKLSVAESTYFQLMLQFDRAKTVEQKAEYYNLMGAMRKKKATTFNDGHSGLFAKWHFWVVLELLKIIEFKEDFAALAARVKPAIKPREAEEAVKVLREMGLIKKNDSGRYVAKKSECDPADERKPPIASYFQVLVRDIMVHN